VTDFPIDITNAAIIVEAGRSRWKVENENNNVLKTKGYHLEHSYGHGKQFLSSVMVTLNLLAFLLHTFLELVDSKYQAIRKTLAARKRFFHDFTTLTKYLFFNRWEHLMALCSNNSKSLKQDKISNLELLSSIRSAYSKSTRQFKFEEPLDNRYLV